MRKEVVEVEWMTNEPGSMPSWLVIKKLSHIFWSSSSSRLWHWRVGDDLKGSWLMRKTCQDLKMHFSLFPRNNGTADLLIMDPLQHTIHGHNCPPIGSNRTLPLWGSSAILTWKTNEQEGKEAGNSLNLDRKKLDLTDIEAHSSKELQKQLPAN